MTAVRTAALAAPTGATLKEARPEGEAPGGTALKAVSPADATPGIAARKITAREIPAPEITAWVAPQDAAAAPPVRLFCLTNAGGSAELFRQWQPILGNGVAVCPLELPGRGRRMGEAWCASLLRAAAGAAAAVAALSPAPFALFGHSLGSVVAMETARVLEREYSLDPVCLFVSGRVPPHAAGAPRGLHAASDADLVNELRRLGGTPEEVLTNEDFLSFLLPIVREDFRLLETYDPALGPLLRAPVRVCCGEADEDVTPDLLERWREVSLGDCSVKLLPGGHFYICESRQALVEHVRSVLEEGASALCNRFAKEGAHAGP